MRKPGNHIIIVLFLIFTISSFCQTSVGSKYDPGIYPNNPFSAILVPNTYESENHIADTIITYNLYPYSQLNMKISNYTTYYDGSSNLHRKVTTSGFIYDFYETGYSLYLSVTQRSQNVSELASDRANILSLVFNLNTTPFSHNMTISNLDTTNNNLNGMICFTRANLYILRFNGDGIVMFKNNGSSNLDITYNLGFYPGYYGKSEPIQVGTSGIYTKIGYSALFLDNYGGFGTYIFPANYTCSVSQSAAGTYPALTITPHINDIIWIAMCPPKAYDWTKDNYKVAAYYGDVEMTDGNDKRIYKKVYPIDTTNPGSNQFINLLKSSINPTVFVNRQHISTYQSSLTDNWHLAFNPKINLSVLNQFLSGFGSSVKKLIYTSPGQFFYGSKFYNSLNPSYYLGLNPLTPQYTLDNGTTVPYIPLFNTIYDFFHDAIKFPGTAWPNGLDNPGNPFGSNLSSYISAVQSLRNNVTSLSGIYLDWYYYFNVPRSYMLARELRNAFPNDFIFAHTHTLPGGDAFLPQVDSYFDLILRGESGYRNYTDYNYFRYYCSGYNISNSPFVFYEDVNNNSLALGQNFPTQYFQYAHIGYEYKAPHMVALYNDSLRTDPDTIGYAQARKTQVDNYYNNILSTSYQPNLKAQISSYYNTAQQKYKNSYYAISQDTLSTNDKFLVGDFNGDGVSDILRVSSTGSLYVAKGVKNSNNYLLERETYWGQLTTGTYDYSQDRILVGDFNGDGLCDVLHLKYSPYSTGSDTAAYKKAKWYVYLSKKDISIPNPDTFTNNSSWISWNTERYWYWDQSDRIFAADFNGDGKCDVMKVVNSNKQWEVALSSGTDFGGNGMGVATWRTWTWNSSDNILVEDFNGDGNADIMKVSLGSSNRYVDSVALQNKGSNGFLAPSQWLSISESSIDSTWRFFTSKLDNTLGADLIYYKGPGHLNVYPSNGSSGFNTPLSPDWFTTNNNAYSITSGEKVNFGDFSGDGYKDICILTPGSYTEDIGVSNLVYSSSNFGTIHDWHINNGNTFQRISTQNNVVTQQYNFKLGQNYPNPFNPTTQIQYSLKNDGFVTLKVYNILGQVVSQLVNEKQIKGEHFAVFNAKDLASGIYFYRIEAEGFSVSKKMVLIK